MTCFLVHGTKEMWHNVIKNIKTEICYLLVNASGVECLVKRPIHYSQRSAVYAQMRRNWPTDTERSWSKPRRWRKLSPARTVCPQKQKLKLWLVCSVATLHSYIRQCELKHWTKKNKTLAERPPVTPRVALLFAFEGRIKNWGDETVCCLSLLHSVLINGRNVLIRLFKQEEGKGVC